MGLFPFVCVTYVHGVRIGRLWTFLIAIINYGGEACEHL